MKYSTWKIISFSTPDDIKPRIGINTEAAWRNVFYINDISFGEDRDYVLIVYPQPVEIDSRAINRFIQESWNVTSPILYFHIKHGNSIINLLEKLGLELMTNSSSESVHQDTIHEWKDTIVSGSQVDQINISNVEIVQVYELRRKELMRDVIGVLGTVGIDLFVDILAWPIQGDEVGAKKIHQFTGGRGYASAIQVAMHNWYAMPIGILGDRSDTDLADKLTNNILQDLRLRGEGKILEDGLVFLPSKQADITVVLNLVDDEKHPAGYISKLKQDVSRTERISEVCDKVFDRLAAISISTDISPRVAEMALQKAKEYGLPSVAYIVPSDLIEAKYLQFANYVIVSPDTARIILELDEPDEQKLAIRLVDAGAKAALVTDSHSYCYFASSGKGKKHNTLNVTGYPTRRFHRLGVRSAFSASLTVRLAEDPDPENFDVESAIKFSLAAGALKAETATLRTMPLRVDVEDLVRFG